MVYECRGGVMGYEPVVDVLPASGPAFRNHQDSFARKKGSHTDTPYS